MVDSILLRSLPYPEADRLVTLYHSYPKANLPRTEPSLTSYYERRGNIPAFTSLAAINEATSVVGETGATSIENLGRVSPEFFATLGIEPFMGRAFKDAEMTYQTDNVAMISYEYWRNHFNSDPAVLGKSVRLSGNACEIVGVLPPNFHFLSFTAPIYSPLSSEESERNLQARHNGGPIQIARLAPHATLAEAQSQIDAHDAAHAAEFPQAKMIAETGFRTHVAALHSDHVASVRPMLLLLQAGALFLLVIGGVNLANLLLVRASGRSRELAIRQALGATQGHVVREVMTETILLTVVGALLGLLAGAFGIELLAKLGAAQLPLGSQITYDRRLALIALAGAVVTGFALGLPIVWFNLRSRLAVALQSESRGSTTSRNTQRLRHGFIVAQIALAFVLLTGAGLLGLSHADESFSTFNCVVDENFARRYWPEGGAVGRQLYRGLTVTPDDKPYTIVGVVGAVKQTGLTEKNPKGSVYFAYNQVQIRNYFLVARTSLPPESLARILAKTIREIDPELPLTNLRSMEVRITDSLATRRSPALLAGIFAATALLLATIGLYGVMSYTVAQRTNEFGIRMALGAQRGDVLRLVFSQGIRLTLVGLVAGLVASVLLTGSMASLLYDVKTNDPFALAAVAILLASVAALACWLPAHRATRVNPIEALRAE